MNAKRVHILHVANLSKTALIPATNAYTKMKAADAPVEALNLNYMKLLDLATCILVQKSRK